jgi:hypothetical protein
MFSCFAQQQKLHNKLNLNADARSAICYSPAVSAAADGDGDGDGDGVSPSSEVSVMQNVLKFVARVWVTSTEVWK